MTNFSTAGTPGDDTVRHHYLRIDGQRVHCVSAGSGQPVLLIPGWPQTWYAWRLVMPALARYFEVVAVDQLEIGLSDKPRDAYDTGTLAGDLELLLGRGVLSGPCHRMSSSNTPFADAILELGGREK